MVAVVVVGGGGGGAGGGRVPIGATHFSLRSGRDSRFCLAARKRSSPVSQPAVPGCSQDASVNVTATSKDKQSPGAQRRMQTIRLKQDGTDSFEAQTAAELLISAKFAHLPFTTETLGESLRPRRSLTPELQPRNGIVASGLRPQSADCRRHIGCPGPTSCSPRGNMTARDSPSLKGLRSPR